MLYSRLPRRRHLIDTTTAKKIDPRATAAGQNHPACRRRKNDVGAGLYIVIAVKVESRRGSMT